MPENKESTAEGDNEDKALVRLTEAERRQKLKKFRRESKMQTKEEVQAEPAEGNWPKYLLVG